MTSILKVTQAKVKNDAFYLDFDKLLSLLLVALIVCGVRELSTLPSKSLSPVSDVELSSSLRASMDFIANGGNDDRG